MSKTEEKEETDRVFLSKAYLKEVDGGLYGLFRDFMVEKDHVVEKMGKSLGPLGLFRQRSNEEPKHMVTVGRDGQVIELFCVSI